MKWQHTTWPFISKAQRSLGISQKDPTQAKEAVYQRRAGATASRMTSLPRSQNGHWHTIICYRKTRRMQFRKIHLHTQSTQKKKKKSGRMQVRNKIIIENAKSKIQPVTHTHTHTHTIWHGLKKKKTLEKGQNVVDSALYWIW